MDSVSIHKIKIQAMNKYRKQQFLSDIVLYILTAMSCSLLVFSPFWYPPLRAIVNVFLSVSLPKVLSLFYSAKVVFIVGNLIVIFLVGEFKIFAVPQSSEAHHVKGHVIKERGNPEIHLSENLKCCQSAKGTSRVKVNSCEPQNGEGLHVGTHQMVSLALKPTSPKIVTVKHEEISVLSEGCSDKQEDLGKKSEGKELKSNMKDLNKMADDFIARVNRQRRLEAELYSIHE